MIHVNRYEECLGDCLCGINVTATAGHAVLFYNLDPGTLENDESSLHAGCDVTTEGKTKWGANKWFNLPVLAEEWTDEVERGERRERGERGEAARAAKASEPLNV